MSMLVPEKPVPASYLPPRPFTDQVQPSLLPQGRKTSPLTMTTSFSLEALSELYICWQSLSAYRKNDMVSRLYGWDQRAAGNPTWITSRKLVDDFLLRAVNENFIQAEVFGQILRQITEQQCQFDAENTEDSILLNLGDEANRACYFLTMLCATNADLLCFAYVVTCNPHILLVAPEQPTQPLRPSLSRVHITALPSPEEEIAIPLPFS